MRSTYGAIGVPKGDGTSSMMEGVRDK